jgi:AcrR family transcriptional regulator
MSTEAIVIEEVTDAKERILAAAEEVFADYGFKGATIRDICKKAEVNIAAVNYHFGDKERLYVETVKRAHTCNARDLPIEELDPPGTSPVVRLERFIRGMVASMHTPARPSAMKLMMREMADPGKAAGTVVDEFIRPLAFRLKGILRELLPDVPEPRLLMTGFSVISQCLFYRQNRPMMGLVFGPEAVGVLTVDMVADHVVGFTLAAVESSCRQVVKSSSPGMGDGGDGSETGSETTGGVRT